MKKMLLVMLGMTVFWGFSLAQKVEVTGKVTDKGGQPLSGATILEKGTTNGTMANAAGVFKLSVSPGAALIISATGFETVTVAASSAALVALTQAANEISEVVVTAQGVRRRPKELGYSVAKVTNSDIMVGRSPQLAQSLSGKVSGLAVFNVNNSVDPAVKITLRGYRSMTGNNDALIVVDGIPMPGSQTILNLINPNDIENISVLKGGQAATLYGSAGVNGALVITTKRGAKGKAKVSFSNATNIEDISFLPDFQDKYGSGSHYAPSYTVIPDYKERMRQNWRSFENQQYGDAFDGKDRIIGRVLEDGSSLIRPYAAIPGIRRKIWNTGITTNNQLSVEGANDVANYRISLENNMAQGIVPEDKSNRTGVRFSAGSETGRLSTRFNASYIQQAFDRTTYNFYYEALNQAAHIPLNELRDWRNNKFANPNGYYNDYYNNPYFRLDNDRQKYNDYNLTGSLDLGYKINDWLTVSNSIGVMNNTRLRKNTVAKFVYTDWAKNSAYVPAPWDWSNDYDGIDRAGSDILGSVYDAISAENILNNDLRLSADKTFGDFTTHALLGFNVYQRKTKLTEVSSGSIVVPNVYNVANRQGELGGGESNSTERKYGYYANLSTGWKDMIFLEGSFRYDFTSRFYKNDRSASLYSYPYYGVGVSAILSDLVPALKGNILSYAKLRASFNRNGNDNISLYGLDLNYNNGPGFPFGNTVGITVGDVLPDKNLKPEFVNTWEVGGEFQLFKNRVNLDVTAYNQQSKGQVLTVKIPNTTGYPNLRLNVGDSKNWGYEGDLKVMLIQRSGFNWDMSLRYSYNDNKVLNLFQGVEQFSYGGFTYAQTFVKKNTSFPLLRTTAYVRDPATNRVIVNKSNGYPIVKGDLLDKGRTIPKHMIGWGTRFNYKGIGLTTNLEYRGGNYIFSQLGRDMTFTGSGKWTENREPHIFPNSAYDDGTGKYVPNTTVNAAESEYSLWVDYYRQIAENFVTPGWFIKIRDINLSYTFSNKLVAKTGVFSTANVGLYGRNLLTIVDKTNFYTDPEFSYTTGNGVGINDTGQTPPVRQYGININLTFK